LAGTFSYLIFIPRLIIIIIAKTCFLIYLQENYPKHSAEVAGDRKFDVYMGIDVFGRNTYGGGQWTVSL